MRLNLIRTYHPSGTNGDLYVDEVFQCHTIELPWLHNQRGISCIPEGEYVLQKRSSSKFGEHLWVKDVPGRSAILVHPANDAKKELRGCIAPVLYLTGEGKGTYSRMALKLLLKLVEHIAAEEPVTLVITSKEKGAVMASETKQSQSQ